ncbi:MAG: hypothetical protein IKE70_04590 [Bacilli bacterium]|nr:hypothetical protein [Bacilli bacterium]
MNDNNLRKKLQRNRIIVAILLLIAVIGVGYATLGANLKINGVAEIPSASWDVGFKTGTVQVTNGSVSGSAVATAATITNSSQVDYAVTLALPGDFYEFTVTAENAGSIDAMIDSFTSKIKIGDGEEQEITSSNLPAYLSYSVTYSDGTAVAAKQKLDHGTSEVFKVRLAYRTDIESTDLPTTNQSLHLNFQVNYVQKDSTAIAVAHA